MYRLPNSHDLRSLGEGGATEDPTRIDIGKLSDGIGGGERDLVRGVKRKGLRAPVRAPDNAAWRLTGQMV
jgi:hypothetical protein